MRTLTQLRGHNNHSVGYVFIEKVSFLLGDGTAFIVSNSLNIELDQDEEIVAYETHIHIT